MNKNFFQYKNVQKLGKTVIIAVTAIFTASIANAQERIAVLDFKAGAGVTQSEVEGLSAIFVTYFTPEGFILVERTQIDKVIAEQGFQYSTLTNQQMVKIGQILNLSKIVIGDVTVISKQYNVEVRAIAVETGEISAKDGATWAKESSFRKLMRNLATRLAKQLFQKPTPTPIRY